MPSDEVIFLKIGDLLNARNCRDPYETAKTILTWVNVDHMLLESELEKERDAIRSSKNAVEPT